MNKKELIKKSISSNIKSKEEILNNILKVVHEEKSKVIRTEEIDLMVLSLIQRKDMYGYEISKEIGLRSKGTFTLNEGGLYPILHGLEGEGLLISYWKEEECNKKYYSLSDKGREFLKEKVRNKKFSGVSKKVLNLEGIVWK